MNHPWEDRKDDNTSNHFQSGKLIFYDNLSDEVIYPVFVENWRVIWWIPGKTSILQFHPALPRVRNKKEAPVHEYYGLNCRNIENNKSNFSPYLSDKCEKTWKDVPIIDGRCDIWGNLFSPFSCFFGETIWKGRMTAENTRDISVKPSCYLLS